MECPSCYQIYNDRKRVPKNLYCGHTYCLECLEIIFKQDTFLQCPTCRKSWSAELKPGDLSKNYIAADLASK